MVGDNLVFDARSANCEIEPTNNGSDWLVFDATIMDAPLDNSVITRFAGIVSQLNFYILIFKHFLKKELDFSCAIETHVTVNAGINVNVNFILVDIDQDIGHFDVSMDVYNSSDFTIPAQ